MTLPTETAHPELEGLGTYEFGWADSDAMRRRCQARPFRRCRP